jgi:hypothetical protein
MDFIEQIRALSARIAKQKDAIKTEEAAKHAFVLPFIAALGYDVFDPGEVVPEIVADVGVKKGEKVDYAIMKDGKAIMLFECKCCGVNLNDCHMSQLYRYFSVTEARIGVLTNGHQYRFFSDLEQPNKLDTRPFLEIDLLEIEEPLIVELKKLTKPAFNLDAILSTANELKYMREIKRTIGEQVQNPAEEFVRFIASQVYTGKFTQAVRDQFTELTKRAFQQFISDRISDRLKSALAEESAASRTEAPAPAEPAAGDADGIVTTDEEREAFVIVKSILRETMDANRLFMRDTKSYCGILADDNNRKPVCRLHFNRGQKYIGVFDADKNEERIPIESLDDIFKVADRLKAAADLYV